jgi:hypothetical protein
MIARPARPLAVAVVAAALLGAALPAGAGASGASDPGASAAGVEATVSVDNCTVRRSRNGGGFTYFYCAVSSDTMPGGSGSVRYTVNLPVFTPRSGGTWSKKTGTVTVGAGPQVINLKFATRRSVAQVRSSLRVTLSDPQGLNIVDGTATAAPTAG